MPTCVVSESDTMRLSARVVGTPSACIASDAKNSRTYRDNIHR